MSVHKRATATKGTTWVVRWRDPRPREKTFRTKAEAEKFERRVGHGLDTGSYRDPRLERVTFGDWHARWWPTARAGRAPNTVAQYETILRLHVLPHLEHLRLGTIRRIDLEEWLALLREEGLGDSSVRRARSLASSVLTSAVDSGVIPANPAAGLRLPRAQSRTKHALTAAQVEALAAEFDEWYRPLVLVLAYGGLRPGEALALHRRHVDVLHGCLLVEEGQAEVNGHLHVADTKTHRARAVPLAASVFETLTEHLATRVGEDPEALIFTTPRGARMRLSNFRRVWNRARCAVGLPEWATPYVLRHTCASLLAQRGVPVGTAADLLGHDPAVYLRTYRHLYPGDLRRAADALDGARLEASREPAAVLELARGLRGDEHGEAGGG